MNDFARAEESKEDGRWGVFLNDKPFELVGCRSVAEALSGFLNAAGRAYAQEEAKPLVEALNGTPQLLSKIASQINLIAAGYADNGPYYVEKQRLQICAGGLERLVRVFEEALAAWNSSGEAK